MTIYKPLVDELRDLFDEPLAALKPPTQERLDDAIFPFSWDQLTRDQRYVLALHYDSENGFQAPGERQAGLRLKAREEDLQWRIEVLQSLSVNTAQESAFKEEQLKQLHRELRRMGLKSHHSRNPIGPHEEYVAYPKAATLLSDSIGATPEEVAAWIWLTPKHGGLDAYRNANELMPPPRFFYDVLLHEDGDYLKPLMGCWFSKAEIDQFRPRERFLTGTALITRWSSSVSHPRAFIEAKIAESRLCSIHPIFGGTREQFQNDEAFPPLDTGLFSLTEIKQIESQDFHAADVPVQPAEAGANLSRQARRNAAIRSKYEELARDGKRNYVKEIQRTVAGAELLSDRRIRDIVKGR